MPPSRENPSVCLRCRHRQTDVGDAPNTGDAPAGGDKQRRRGQAYKRHQQGVFDKILPLLVAKKVNHKLHHLNAFFPTISRAIPSRAFH